MKTVGYVRVSDQKLKTDGARRQDIDRQKNKITKFSENMGWGTPEFYSDDGISAFKEDYNSRPAFCKMLREVRANRIQRIIVEDLTRWSRRIEDGLKTMRDVSKKCTVTSMAEGEVDITLPTGWFKTAIAFLLAEWSSKSTSYKVQSGMLRRLEDPDAVCKSCGVVHLGRHPKTCGCKNCLKRKKPNAKPNTPLKKPISEAVFKSDNTGISKNPNISEKGRAFSPFENNINLGASEG